MTPTELLLQLRPLMKKVEERAPERVLDQVTAAREVAEELGRVGELLINAFVDKARTEGRSWAEIGTSLGVSRQAAQQRIGRFQQVPLGPDGLREKSSPFSAWRMNDSGEIEVQIEPGQAWQRLASLDGYGLDDLIKASRRTDPKRWFKRLSEDLEDVYNELGATLGPTALVVLIDAAGRRTERELAVTIAKRKAAWRFNNPDAGL